MEENCERLRRWKGIIAEAPEIFLEQASQQVQGLEAKDIQQLYTLATASDPVNAFRFARNFANNPWAKDLLIQAATSAPASAFAHMDQYQAQPWANNVALAAVKTLPAAAKIYERTWKKLPFAGEIRQAMAPKTEERSGFVAAQARRNGGDGAVTGYLAQHGDGVHGPGGFPVSGRR